WTISMITTKNPPGIADVPADKQPNYTIAFAPDGTFAAQADCNQFNGTYATVAAAPGSSASPGALPSGTFNPGANSGGLTIVPGQMTQAACAPGSYGDYFVLSLGKATSYNIDATNTLT